MNMKPLCSEPPSEIRSISSILKLQSEKLGPKDFAQDHPSGMWEGQDLNQSLQIEHLWVSPLRHGDSQRLGSDSRNKSCPSGKCLTEKQNTALAADIIPSLPAGRLSPLCMPLPASSGPNAPLLGSLLWFYVWAGVFLFSMPTGPSWAAPTSPFTCPHSALFIWTFSPQTVQLLEDRAGFLEVWLVLTVESILVSVWQIFFGKMHDHTATRRHF